MGNQKVSLPFGRASIASGYTPATVPAEAQAHFCGPRAKGQREECSVYSMLGYDAVDKENGRLTEGG